MLLKALDLLRTLGWGLISFVFSLIDSLFEIIKQMNAFDIIDSMAQNSIFRNLHSSILAISLTLFGLFVVWSFVKKIIDPDDGLSSSQILKEIFKCGAFILLSTFLFAQVSSFSIQLSNFTANIFKANNTELSDSMLGLYVDFSDSYKVSDNPDLNRLKLDKAIGDDSFTDAKMYNDKFVTNDRFILPNEKDYKYSVNWIMAIIIGGFFLYALFFSGMMLARRQIEFLFLFTISPVVFATSIGNKNRRSAVIEQLVSLTLQAAVVMLIINITALIMQAVNNTTFFNNGFQDIVIKSLMFIGCGSFLLTGSQVVNRFIGGNVSANSGREQLMSMMGFGQSMGMVASTGGLALGGAGMFGLGAVAKGAGSIGTGSNRAMAGIGHMLNGFGNKLSNSSISSGTISGIGSKIASFGSGMENRAMKKNQPVNKDGMTIPSRPNRLSRLGSMMMDQGKDGMQSAIDTIMQYRNPYRRRMRYKE